MAFLLCAVLALGVPAPSFGAPAAAATDIQAKRAEAAKASADLRGMRDRLSAGLAGYGRVNTRLVRTRREIADNEKRLRVLKRRLSKAESGLGVRADYIYRTRGTGMLDVLLSAATFDQFVERLDILTSLATHDASVVSEVKRARAEATRLRGTLKERETMLVALQRKADDERSRVQAEVDAQEARLGSLDADVARMVRDADRATSPSKTARPVSSRHGGRGTSPKRSTTSGTVEQHPGVAYTIMAGEPTAYTATGVTLSGKASIYSTAENGTGTASGHPLNDSELTCAHPSLPFGTRLAVSRGGRHIIVVVTDRGPYTGGRILDLTVRAAAILGIDGVGKVTAEVVEPL